MWLIVLEAGKSKTMGLSLMRAFLAVSEGGKAEQSMAGLMKRTAHPAAHFLPTPSQTNLFGGLIPKAFVVANKHQRVSAEDSKARAMSIDFTLVSEATTVSICLTGAEVMGAKHAGK